MRKDITIVADERPLRGGAEAGRLRRQGKSPATVYGPGRDAIAVAINPKELNKILHSSTGHNTIFNLDIAGKETTPVMIVDWQHDPVRGSLMHVDLKRIDLAKRIVVKVPVHTEGDPKGVKLQGGSYEVVNREVEIECLPDEIPENFTVNVAELMLNQSVRAGDLPLAGTMKLRTAADLLISHVVAPKAEAAAPADAAAPGTAEPEVIKKGKKEEAAAEGADAKKKK
jgi:large subunit ribosomal protein L25